MSVTTQASTPSTVPANTVFAADVVGAASAPAAGQVIPYTKLDIGSANPISAATSPPAEIPS